ncbi:tail-anchored protein insertion receptor [Geosmithia morbida]|uniref:Tail-anchored protein insertion receptor n=1 Tax=Geosmithia morbida TaxID=1094350 RepID=A0A9P4YPM9_9HYPO|nr:tail-anchored protein insertion receptor [Geosmithia morbida]KAF4119428.1 tail-anchored protein insertion receptor [Geosmithia morbida]
MMPFVLALVFTIEVVSRLINAIGSTVINDFVRRVFPSSPLWTLVNYLPISTSKSAAQQRKLQAEYLKVRAELNATSSQDEFAKWARIRRQHDKLLEKLEATKKTMEAARGSFDKYVNGVRIIVTKVPQYLVPFWYSNEPMFWIPHGWFPYYAEWIISFPRAPLGSVSVASWQLACSGVIALVSDLISGIYGLMRNGSYERAAGKTAATDEKKEL